MKLGFTTDQYPGALPNGTVVTKVGTDETDFHRDGAPARVLGSLGKNGKVLGYFVEWFDVPGAPCWVSAYRAQPIDYKNDGNHRRWQQ